MKVSLLSLCLLVLVGSCHAGNGAGTLGNGADTIHTAHRGASTPHTSHHAMMVRPVRKPIVPKEIGTLSVAIEGWFADWKLAGLSPPTIGAKSPEFVESIVRDIIDRGISCPEDGSPFVYTSIFGGNLCFDYLVVRALREYGGFACDIHIQNIEVLDLSVEAEAYIKRHADVEHIRHYKGVYHFVEEEKKRSPSDVVVSTQPDYFLTLSLKNNPTESQVFRFIIDDDSVSFASRVEATTELWAKKLNPGTGVREISLEDLFQKGGMVFGTRLRCLRNVRHGLLRLREMTTEEFATYTSSCSSSKGWIHALGCAFTNQADPKQAIADALGVVRAILSFFEVEYDLVVPCFVDDCLVYRAESHKANENAGHIQGAIDSIIRASRESGTPSRRVFSDQLNNAINQMMGRDLHNLDKTRSTDLTIALYDVLASTSKRTTRAYILRGESGPEEFRSVDERNMWQGLKMGSSAEMQALCKRTVQSIYESRRMRPYVRA